MGTLLDHFCTKPPTPVSTPWCWNKTNQSTENAFGGGCLKFYKPLELTGINAQIKKKKNKTKKKQKQKTNKQTNKKQTNKQQQQQNLALSKMTDFLSTVLSRRLYERTNIKNLAASSHKVLQTTKNTRFNA